MKKYDWVEVRPYAGMKPEKVDAFIRSIESMGADYVLTADLDRLPCVTRRKLQIQVLYKSIIPQNIGIVVTEIECWYLAGLDEESCKRLGIPAVGRTEGLTKETFLEAMPKKYDSRIDWMTEILKAYSPGIAIDKNASFKYFCDKWLA